MTISFSDRVKVPDDVLISTLQTESVILNLKSECYFGLDEVGTRILSVLSTSESIQAAYDTLLDEYEVEGEVLRLDLISLIQQLVERGVVEITRGEIAGT
jgi:predicted RNA-binding protein